MTTHRTAYVAIFAVASLLAAGVYYLAQPRAEAVRARIDIPALAPISADMVELVQIAPDARPADAATSLAAVVGSYAALPMLAGQYVDTRALESTPGAQAFGFGAALPTGHVAFAVPVEPSQAVGGALAAGAQVVVVAVPNAMRTQIAGADEDAPEPVVLGEGVVVLALRTGDGERLTELAAGERPSGALRPTLGSVVLAVPAADLPRYAAAVLSSTIYLALSPQSPGEQASE